MQTFAEENARLAVYWLIKSSEQGNEEATLLLRDCYDSGNGIIQFYMGHIEMLGHLVRNFDCLD